MPHPLTLLIVEEWQEAVSAPGGDRRRLVLVAQLRQKLEEDPSAPRIVLTEPGVGYRLATDDDL